MTHTILSRLGLLVFTASLGVSVTACDPEGTVEDPQARELDYDALDDLIEEVKAEVEESEQDAVDPSIDLPLTDDAAPVASMTLEECLVQYCLFNDPGHPTDGQCVVNPHPFGMEGVCILDNPPMACAAFQWYGEYCSSVSSIASIDS